MLRPDAPRFTIVGASDAYLRTTMTERSAILGRGLFEVFPDNPNDPAATGVSNASASLGRVIAGAAFDTMAVQKYDARTSPDGPFEERYWSPANFGVRSETGELRFILHRVEDVTAFVKQSGGGGALAPGTGRLGAEILRAGEDLQSRNLELRAANESLALKSESQFRLLFDLMPQLGWTCRPDGYIDFYNRGWYDYTGQTFASMEGWGWRDVHDPAMLPLVTERWKHSLATGQPFEMEFPLRRADGAFRWFLTRVLPVRDQAGEIVRWVGINTDVHDSKQASVTTDAHMRFFIASVKDHAIFMLDPRGVVCTWNQGAEHIKQWRADEIIGKHFSVFYPPEALDLGLPARELAEAARTGRFEERGYRLRKDGSRFWADVVISAIRGAGGELIGFSKVTRDLTVERRAEEERLGLGKAQEAIRLRDEFLSIAAHELKTPLTSLQLITSGLLYAAKKRSVGPEILLSRIGTLDGQLGRLGSLVNDLLEVSRGAAGNERTETAPVALLPLVEGLTDRLTAELAEAGCELRLHVEKGVVGSWDRLRLERVVANLLGNAIKFGAGHPIEIAGSARGGVAVLSVRDQGIGIALSEHTRIFERFVRGVSAENYGGLGLGLWIARRFVETMGGTISVESAPGEGACFTVTLPLAAEVAVAQHLHRRHQHEGPR